MLIGFCGYSKAGKDEAIKGLSGFERIGFADPLKAELAASLSISIEELELRKEEFREAMVELGARRRAESPGYWIRAVTPKVEQLIAEGKSVGITDVRYADEARWAKSLGGHIVYIDRPGVGPANAEEKRSIQEILDDKLFGSVLHNDSTVEQLHARAARLALFYKEMGR